MIEAILAPIGRATSQNTVNLAIIDALNVMTPSEVVATMRVVRQATWRFPGDVPEGKVREFTRIVRDAVRRTLHSMYNAGKPSPEPYARQQLLPGILLFGGRGAREQRTLVVGFPGNGGRLMMPIPIILQHLSAGTADLVLVPDRAKAAYRKGIAPLADTVEEALVHLKHHLPGGYRRVATFGTSSGGIPSLLAASVLGADTALAVGAGHPDDEHWTQTRGVSKRQLLEAAAPGLAGHRITLAFGAQSPADAISADAITGIVPHARTLSVSIPGVEVKHAALFPMVERSRLRPFLAEHLGLPQ